MEQLQRLLVLAVLVTASTWPVTGAPVAGAQAEGIADSDDDAISKQQQQQQQQQQQKRDDGAVDSDVARRDDEQKDKRGGAIAFVTEMSDTSSEGGGGGGSSKTIIIVIVIVLLLVAVGVTVFAQKKKILCFKPKPGAGDDATGESPLLKGGTSSPSKVTTASATTLDKSRPSGTTVSAR